MVNVLQNIIGKRVARLTTQTMEAVDSRVSSINEVLQVFACIRGAFTLTAVSCRVFECWKCTRGSACSQVEQRRCEQRSLGWNKNWRIWMLSTVLYLMLVHFWWLCPHLRCMGTLETPTLQTTNSHWSPSFVSDEPFTAQAAFTALALFDVLRLPLMVSCLCT